MLQDWVEIELGEAAIYLNGRAFKPKEWEEIGKPIIRIQNLNKPDAQYNYTTNEYEERYRVVNGNLLFAWSASLGAFIWRGGEAWLNQHIFKVEPKKGVYKYYLYYVLKNFIAHLYSKAHGSGMVHITKKEFEVTPFPLAPLPEQRAIVAKIELLFSELDNGIANLQAAKDKLEIYRQAVLKNAFEGDYPTKPLGDLADVIGGVTKGKKNKDKKLYSYPYLRVANVQDGYLDLSVVKSIDLTEQDFLRYRLEYEDVLFTEGGDKDKLGRGTVWKSEIDHCIHQNHIFRARVNKELLNPYFLSYFSSSAIGKDYFFKNGKQTTNLASINKTILSSRPVPIPTLKRQSHIVQEVESNLSHCNNVLTNIEDGLEKAEALRQIILKKAFEGKLLSEEELEACRREPDWEPAEKLVERVNKEKIKDKSSS